MCSKKNYLASQYYFEMFLKHFSLSLMSDTMDSYLSVSTLPYSCPFLDLLRVWLCKPNHRQMFFCLYFYLLVFMTLSLFLSYLNSISRYHLPSQFMLSPQSMAYLTESPSCYIFLIHVSRSTFFLSLPSPSVSVLYEISSRPYFLSLRFVIINSLAHLKCTFHTSNPLS